ncbi:MAG: histidinol-phosphatase HisJ family protein [Clostridiaceae bacterium]|nr:histidinol-phosphatase HisJ family protein [Clostridiaceae bacterium]
MLIDHHTHIVPYSSDARQTLSDLRTAVSQNGLDGVCITDHYEKDIYYIAGREDVFSLDEYFKHLQPYRQIQAGAQPLLLIGVELGYLPHLNRYYGQIAAEYPFDAVILSLHILDGEDPYVDEKIYRHGKAPLYTRYLERMCEMMVHCPDFDILGHYDYITRYATYDDPKMRYRETPEAFDALFRILIDTGKTLEINTRTIIKLQKAGYAGEDAWPDPEIITRYKQLGGRRISLGSDAHQPGEPGGLFHETADWLRDLGCRQLVYYIGRQAVMTSL